MAAYSVNGTVSETGGIDGPYPPHPPPSVIGSGSAIEVHWSYPRQLRDIAVIFSKCCMDTLVCCHYVLTLILQSTGLLYYNIIAIF